MRLTLSIMRPDQARKHYDNLVKDRIWKGWMRREAALNADPKVRMAMVREAMAVLNKAERWASPMAWHTDRALDLKHKYGMGVAAAFLAAHGWDINNARKVLF